MSTLIRPVGRRILAATLPAALLVGTAATTAPASADPQVPPQTVTITGVTDPLYYGDTLRFNVNASGSDDNMVVLEGEDVVFGPVTMENIGSTPVAIPTLDQFRAGTTHRLTVSVANEVSTGTKSLTITPSFIPSGLEPAGFQQEYGLPLYGRVDPAVPTTLTPTGNVALARAGEVTVRSQLRTDRTYGLYDPTMTPGVYPNVEFYYEGDANYARQEADAGKVTADVTILPQHTTTTSGLTADTVTTGDSVELLAATVSANAESVVDPSGTMEVYASPDGQHFDKIAGVSYPGGKQQVRIPLTAWARTHPGLWTIRAVFPGDNLSRSSASQRDNTLKVVEPGTPVKDTTTALTLSSSTTTVQSTSPVTATATVTSAGGPVREGDVRFSVRGQVVATVPVGADGKASTPLTVREAGEPQVVATYVGTTEYAGSPSAPQPLTVAKAATTTTATVPSQPVAPGSVLAVQVRPTGSSVAPTGSVVVTEGGTFLGSVNANGGQTQLRLPQLSPGNHQLTIAYGGDLNTEGSRTTVTYPVGASTTPGKQVTSTTAMKVKKVVGGKAKVKVTVSASSPVVGTVVIRRGSKVVASGTVQNGKLVLTTKKLKKGKNKLVAQFTGSATVLASTSKAVTVRVR